jgi:predicted nuclease with TOPRIM domain
MAKELIMNEITFFDDVAAVGSRILQVLGGTPPGSDSDRYLQLVEEIYAVLAQIHDGIVDVMIDVSQAQTMQQAVQSLTRVQQMDLRDALKAQSLCDELARLGNALRELPDKVNGLTPGEKQAWDELCQQLERREGGTARLYDLKLYDLRVLPHNMNTLGPLKAEVEKICNVLVVQKAQFEYLAKQAKATRSRR